MGHMMRWKTKKLQENHDNKFSMFERKQEEERRVEYSEDQVKWD